MSSERVLLRVSAVLFDLDGTLADSAPDLAFVLNQQLQSRGRPAMSVAALRPYVSQGARGLLRTGFGIVPGDPEYAALRDEFLDLYERNLHRETRLFPGIAEVLAELEEVGVAWGVVTNKLERFALPLVQALGLDSRAACVIGGDTTGHTK
ncbi:MAG: phosphoglycolate phosphatase, partial [Proteobacteria bacterium]